MTNLVCAKPLQGTVLRATRLDSCGNPETGECVYAVSDGWVSATLTPNSEEGERFLQRNAAGRAIVNQRSAPILNWFDVSIVFQEVDPELFTILTGLDPYYDDQDRVIGFPVTSGKFATASFSLELWLGNAEDSCEAEEGALPYFGYSLLPWVVEGAISGEIAIANGLITFTVAARTREGTPWAEGPYDVVLDQTGDPVPLYTPIPSDTHYLPIWTQLAPPEASCGCLPSASS